MIKEIKYSGYSASPSDYESPDGELAAAVNLIPEDGALHPVLPSKELFTMPEYYEIKFIHNTSAYKHYILYNTVEGNIAWIDAADTTHTLNVIHTDLFNTDELYKIDAVGNTLLVLTPYGMYYFLWKGSTDGYFALGNHLPECDLEFSLASSVTYESEEYEVDFSGTLSPSSILGDSELRYKLETALFAAVNSAVAKSADAKKFAFPFFVRYAYRLVDGESITMHSAPILMIPTLSPPTSNMGWTQSGSGAQIHYTGPAKVKASVTGYSLQYIADFSIVHSLQNFWADIIMGIDVYISPMFYTYDQAGKMTGNFTIRSKDVKEEITDNANFFLLKHLSLDDLYYGTPPSSSSSSSASAGGRVRPSTPPSSGIIISDFALTNDNIVVHTRMTDDYDSHDLLRPKYCYGFNGRLNLAGITKSLYKGYSPNTLFFVVGNSNTQTTEYKVVIDYGDKEIIVASSSANVKFDSNGTVVWFYYPNTNAKSVFVKVGSAVQALNLKQHSFLNGAYYLGLDTTVTTGETMPNTTTGDDALVHLPNKIYTSALDNPFFFPLLGINSIGTGTILGIVAAVKPLSQGQLGEHPLYAFATDGVWALTLSEEGAYAAVQPATMDVCINSDSITQTEDSVLFATDRGIMIITGNHAVCITDVLDGKGADVFGELPSGHVAAIKNKAEALGLVSGSLNFVPFKTYVASAKLIYDYTHQRIILFNPNTSYNYAYVFSLESKAWGMMATNLVDSLNSYPNALAVDSDRHLLDMCQEVTEVEVSTPSAAPSTTPTTQSNPGASTSIGDPVATEPSSGIAEPGEEYGGSGSSGTQSENTGESSSETSGGESTTTDETEEAEEATTTTVPVTVPAVLVTRPLKLELPEILKTVDRVIQRGRLNIHASGHVPVQSILYGSRDLYHWHMVKSSTDHQLRGFRGTPYKYFKIVLLCNLLPDESLYGASVSLEARYTNRPR